MFWIIVLQIWSVILPVNTLPQVYSEASERRNSVLDGDVTVLEGSSVFIHCNVSGVPDHCQWFNSRGENVLHREHPGSLWTVERDGLNISSVGFEDRGRYTCVSWTSSGVQNFTVTLRVRYTHSGLGLYFVVICLVSFSITMVLNSTRLCLVSSHLRKTQQALDAFFTEEGPEKLQKALEVAKRIPIITSTKTAEFAKVTQFKTMEFARHMEELARSIPLPPLILNCRTLGGEGPEGLAETRGPAAIEENPSLCLAEMDIKVSVHTPAQTRSENNEDSEANEPML
ncbi:microfibrillar-associated protein 3-like [Hoplias malabaricus]|uniref:microfibrillar-associated protein 3-like n=1 Tax=Hoplias malabaricus TaxID=27720 RepID=UPI003461895D